MNREKWKNLPLFTFFCIHKKKELDSWKFSTFGCRWIYKFWDVLKTIKPFLENVCLYVCLQNFADTISQELMRRNLWNFMFSSTLISLTQWYRTKLRAAVPNTNYFKPIILTFKTFIYISNGKIIYNFLYMGVIFPP